jgi:hypothetical protein
VNFNPPSQKSAIPELIDTLLADIAIRVQLNKTEHDKVVDRFDVMREWIDRQASPLRGLADLMYPQGSMAIGATVARVGDRDEYDIDVIVNLRIAQDSDPELRHAAIKPCAANPDLGTTERRRATLAVFACPTRTGCTLTSRRQYSWPAPTRARA